MTKYDYENLIVIIIAVLYFIFPIVIGIAISKNPATQEEKLCYFNHWTWASYDNGECRVITIYK